jgi:galactosyl transferase GMA12/MNN10 family
MSNLKICFVQVTSPEIQEYSNYSVALNKIYCKRHDYNYLELSAINTNEYFFSWSKIFQVRDILKSDKYTHVFFLDADAIVLNRDIKLEDIISKMKTSIAFSENGWNGGDLINAGSFIATPEAIKILEECIRLSEEDMKDKKLERWHEQSVINKMYADGIEMDVFPMNEINSHWLYDFNSNDGQFIYHFMARQLNKKIEIAKELFEKYK